MKLIIQFKDESSSYPRKGKRPVQSKANDRFGIDVKLEDTVADVKKNIETVQGTDVYPAAQQELLFRGKVLEDGTTLEEIGVGENSFIVLIRLSKSKKSAGKASTAAAARKQKEVTTDDIPTSTTMREVPRTRDHFIQKYGRTMLRMEIGFLLNKALQKTRHPHLKDEVCVFERLEGRRKHYGDYLCYNILCVCELLRSKDPNLFEKTQPKSIAEEIKRNFPKSEMIKELTIHDVGFLSFTLDGKWIAESIRKNLKDGIVAWSPIAAGKRAIVDFPTRDIDSEMRAEHVRSSYIRDSIVNMLEYSGVEVSSTMCNDQSLNVVRKYFPEEDLQSLFVIEGEVSRRVRPNNVHADLAAIWCGIYVQKAEWLIYVTPLRQREYIKKCFKVVEGYYEDESFAGDRNFKNEDHPKMAYLGYQTSDDEQTKLAVLWERFESFDLISVEEVPPGCGYSPEAVFECAIKFEYLKKNRYSDCTLEIDEMLSREGNNFVSLLRVQAAVHRILEKHMFEIMPQQQALVGREREMGIHLLQFTEIIEESFLTFTPHLVCEYVWKLSKNFISYSREVRPSEISLLLCEATKVVMDKCFDLLGITPESSKGLPSYLKRQSGKPIPIREHCISWPISGPNPKSQLTPRFEIFSLMVGVSHKKFEIGNLFGYITLSDKDALLSDLWCCRDEHDFGHVAYFHHEWDDSVGIHGTSFLSFDNTSPMPTVSFSSPVEIDVSLFVTTKEKDACFQLCDGKGDVPVPEIWDGDDKSIKQGIFSAKSDVGEVGIFYICLKDAVDISMCLSYEPTFDHLKVSGSILAYYGGDALDGKKFDKEFFKAKIYHIESTTLEASSSLQLSRSRLSVPRSGILVIDAFFKDADSGEILVKKRREFPAKDYSGLEPWHIEGTKCTFNLKVVWNPAANKL